MPPGSPPPPGGPASWSPGGTGQAAGGAAAWQSWAPNGASPQPAAEQQRESAGPATAGGPSWARPAAATAAGPDAPAAAADAEPDAAPDEGTRRHPYTWLHFIVLVLVAFVLGFVIMLVVIKSRGADDASALAPAVDLLAAAWRAGPPAV